MNKKEMKAKVEDEVVEQLKSILGDSYYYVIHPEKIIDYAVNDVFTTSALHDEWYYSKGDIVLACQRAIAMNL